MLTLDWLCSNEGMFQAFSLVWQTAQIGRLHKTGGTYYQNCMYPIDSAWPAFLMPFLLLWPVSGHHSRGFTVPPTKRAYSALHSQALTECSPMDSALGRSFTDVQYQIKEKKKKKRTEKNRRKKKNTQKKTLYKYTVPYSSELHIRQQAVCTPSRTLRFSSDTHMLKIQQYKRKTQSFRIFSCFRPHIWNSLPKDLRHCSAPSSLKSKRTWQRNKREMGIKWQPWDSRQERDIRHPQ